MLRNPSDLAEGFKVNCYSSQAEQSVVNGFGLPPDATSPSRRKSSLGCGFWGGCGCIPRGLVAACVTGCWVAALCLFPRSGPPRRGLPGFAVFGRDTRGESGSESIKFDPESLDVRCQPCPLGVICEKFYSKKQAFLISWRPGLTSYLQQNRVASDDFPWCTSQPGLGLGDLGIRGPGRFRAADHGRIRPAGWPGGQGITGEAQGRAPSPV